MHVQYVEPFAVGNLEAQSPTVAQRNATLTTSNVLQHYQGSCCTRHRCLQAAAALCKVGTVAAQGGVGGEDPQESDRDQGLASRLNGRRVKGCLAAMEPAAAAVVATPAAGKVSKRARFDPGLLPYVDDV